MKTLKSIVYGLLLASTITTSSSADCTFELFNISSTQDTRVIDFVEQLSDECHYSIVITDPQAQAQLDKKLNKTHIKNLTIDEVFNIILTNNNLSYKLENNVLEISYLTTKVFEIDYLLSQRKGVGSTDVTLSSSSASEDGSGSNADSGIKIETTDEVKFWEELDLELQGVLNRPQDEYIADAPIVNMNAGLITVTATQKQMKRLGKYLKKLQSKVQLQVLIDVQLLTVTMSEGQTTGIDWKQLYALQNVAYGASFSNAIDTTKTIPENILSGASVTSKVLTVSTSGALNEVMKFLKTQGDVSAISNPKVLTLNNQPALITVGTDYFYKITTTETLTDGGTGTQNSTEDPRSVFAGVLLDITPEISTDRRITLKINPSLSETVQDMAATTSEGRTMPPDMERRQLSSVVTVKDGGKIVLGGLINTKMTKKSDQIPLLGSIPILGYMFKYEEKSKVVQEFVIIIEPHIIDRTKNDLSLSDLGYEGFDDSVLNSTGRTTKTKNSSIVK